MRLNEIDNDFFYKLTETSSASTLDSSKPTSPQILINMINGLGKRLKTWCQGLVVLGMVMANSLLRQRPGKGDGGGAVTPLAAAGQRVQANKPLETPNQMRIVAAVVLGPILLLLILYPTLRYIYHVPEVLGECSGTCMVTEADLASAPEDCKPSNPHRLFFIHIPRTASVSMHSLMKARRQDKGYTMQGIKDWKDASMWNPIFANKIHLKASGPGYYENMYSQQSVMTIFPNRTARALFFGKTFLFDVHDTTLEWQRKASSEMRFIAMFREPIARLRSQYMEFEEFEDKKRRHFGEAAGEVFTFEECAGNKLCRAEKKFSQWCNLQTAMTCGFGSECLPGRDRNATVPMLQKALQNLKTKFAAVGIQENFDDSANVLERRLPTYFEGIGGEIEAACPGGTSDAPEGVCPYKSPSIARKEAAVVDDDLAWHLKDDCWADTLLYQYVATIFAQQRDACGLA